MLLMVWKQGYETQTSALMVENALADTTDCDGESEEYRTKPDENERDNTLVNKEKKTEDELEEISVDNQTTAGVHLFSLVCKCIAVGSMSFVLHKLCSPDFLLILVHGYIQIQSCSCPSNYVAVAVCSVQMQLLT